MIAREVMHVLVCHPSQHNPVAALIFTVLIVVGSW